MKLQLAHDL